jgi:hypothetical protein
VYEQLNYLCPYQYLIINTNYNLIRLDYSQSIIFIISSIQVQSGFLPRQFIQLCIQIKNIVKSKIGRDGPKNAGSVASLHCMLHSVAASETDATSVLQLQQQFAGQCLAEVRLPHRIERQQHATATNLNDGDEALYLDYTYNEILITASLRRQ